MTDRDANDRQLRLNAALDGELDAMGSLAFEREMRDDPAIAAEYQRLSKLRDAVRRHAPREAAPHALADRIAAMTASAPAAPSPQPAAAPSATVVPFRRRTCAACGTFIGIMISIGTCGFSYKDWIGPVYPAGTKPADMLPLYAAKFPVVEIDSTYYGVPKLETVASWVSPKSLRAWATACSQRWRAPSKSPLAR